ncbi:MAG: DUF2911 domain-containing protein [Ferruginibacter sp.]
MRKYLLLIQIVFFTLPLCAQQPFNAAAPNGYTKKAIVSEQVGLTQVSITYHRPSVNGREGKIWGQLVHEGFIDQGFGNGNPAPWRAGANKNTIIEFDSDVKLEGQALPKGKYGFFIAYNPVESILIFSRRTDAWGSFFYDEKEDVLRIKVKPQPLDRNVEYLKYEFSNQGVNASLLTLSWEKLSIAFKIEVDYLKQQFEAFITESQKPAGFTAQGLNIAATWCLQNNYQLEKGLEWATLATGTNFPGDPTSFPALSTKAVLLEKLGKTGDASAVINLALPYGSIAQLQQLGRQLLTLQKPKEALVVFQYNYNKNPDQFVTVMGMVRGLSANAEYAKALKFARQALTLAPNDSNKEAVKVMVEKLNTGKDIN